MGRSVLQRYRQLGLWGRLGAWGSVASIVGIALVIVWPQPSGVIQTANSPGGTVIQSGRDTIIGGGPQRRTSIQSVVVEGRLTCTLRRGAELPPPEVPFLPVGDADAYLQ